MSMYNFHNVCKNTQDYVFSFIGSARSTQPAFSMALASVIVNTLQHKGHLAPSIGAGAASLFMAQSVEQRLCTLNEMIRINIDDVIAYAHKFYGLRCGQLDWSGWNDIIRKDSAVEDFFGISRFFSKEDICLIKEEGDAISADILRLNQLINELGLFQDEKN